MDFKLLFPILLFAFVFSSCEKEEEPDGGENPPPVDISQQPASVGDYRQGGIVFWVNPADSTQGLIVATNDLFQSVRWGCYGTFIGHVNQARLTNLYGGEQNTADIRFSCNSADCAAYYCDVAVIEGYSDWWLPNRDEWREIVKYLDIIEAAAASTPGGKGFYDKYWTSNQPSGVVGEDLARSFDIRNNIYDLDSKNELLSVRPVRAFAR